MTVSLSMIGNINTSEEEEKLKKIERDNERFYHFNVEGFWYSIITCAVDRIASKTLLVGTYKDM